MTIAANPGRHNMAQRHRRARPGRRPRPGRRRGRSRPVAVQGRPPPLHARGRHRWRDRRRRLRPPPHRGRRDPGRRQAISGSTTASSCVFQPHRYSRTPGAGRQVRPMPSSDADVLLRHGRLLRRRDAHPRHLRQDHLVGRRRGRRASARRRVLRPQPPRARRAALVRPRASRRPARSPMGAGDVTQIGPLFIEAMRERAAKE